MKGNFGKVFGVAVSLMVLVAPFWRASAARSHAFQAATAVERARQMRRTALGEETAAAGTHAWLLKPKTWNMLSSAGQRGALILNGLLKLPSREEPVSSAAYPSVSAQTSAGQNVRVDDPTLDRGSHTHSETSITVNGSNIVEAYNDADTVNADGYAFSADGGNTWTASRLPPAVAGAVSAGDPVVVFGPSGDLYYSSIAFIPRGTNFESVVQVGKSTDGGAVFSAPVVASAAVSNVNDTQDKPWTTVDKGASSLFKGHVYTTWTDFVAPSKKQPAGAQFINVATSTDGGATFSTSVAVTPTGGGGVQGSMPAVDANGNLYVAYEDTNLNPFGISIVKSTDGGKTFSIPTPVATFNPISSITGGGNAGNGSFVRTNNFPSVAIGPNGAIHVVFNAVTTPLSPDRSDIYYVTSSDGGQTFSQPVKLNDDATTTTQVFPSIAAAPDGTLMAKWWDRRNDKVFDSLTDVYATISTDGGAHWSPNFRVTDHNWVAGPIENSFNAGYHGDYDSVTADSTNFYLAWSDERNNEPDAFFTFFPHNQSASAPDFDISANKLYDSVIAGNSVAFGLSTSAFNGFSGSLTLSATPPNSGMTYNFSSSTVAVGSPASLSVQTSAATPPGTYLISATASGGGLTRSTNFRLTVYDTSRTASNPINATRTAGFTSINNGLAVDSTGLIHIAFDDDSAVGSTGSEVYHANSADGGHTFSPPVLVSTNSPFSINSTLAADRADNIYEGWTSFDQNTGNGEIFVSKSTDHGVTFSPPVMVSQVTQDTDLAQIATGPSGKVIVTYLQDPTGIPALFASTSSDGVTFSTPVRISGSAEAVSTTGASAAFDSSGAAYVVYSDASSSPFAIRLAVAPSGQGFGASQIIERAGASSSFAPRVDVDSAGKIYVTFYLRIPDLVTGNFNREVELVESCDKGVTFSQPLDVSNNLGQSEFPAIAVDSSGGISIAWEDTTGNPEEDIFVARSTDGGATFSAPENISANSGVSAAAEVAVAANGQLFVGWRDDSTAETDVFVCSLAALSTGSSDFDLDFSTTEAGVANEHLNPNELDVTHGSKGQIVVFIGRSGGFSGDVTITQSGARGFKIKPGSVTGSCFSAAAFSYKVKGGAPVGSQPFVVTGADSSGRTHTATLNLVVTQ